MQSQAIEKSIEQNKTHFLRRVLRANAIFSTLSALIVILLANPLAAFIGIPDPLALYILGIGLLPFAWFVNQTSRQEELNEQFVKLILILDLLWVGGSYLLIFSGIVPFTTAGKWIVGLLAEVVFIFAILEFIGLRRLGK